MNSPLIYIMVGKPTTYQLIILHSPLAPEFSNPPPLALIRPVLHLFICHKLQCAIADAYQGEGCATIEAAPTFIAIYRTEPT